MFLAPVAFILRLAVWQMYFVILLGITSFSYCQMGWVIKGPWRANLSTGVKALDIQGARL